MHIYYVYYYKALVWSLNLLLKCTFYNISLQLKKFLNKYYFIDFNYISDVYSHAIRQQLIHLLHYRLNFSQFFFFKTTI